MFKAERIHKSDTNAIADQASFELAFEGLAHDGWRKGAPTT
jgi:hypothetical protein